MKRESWWVKHFGSRKLELEFNMEWGDLTTYNSEVARGIVHTPEYKAKMQEKQARWDSQHSLHAWMPRGIYVPEQKGSEE